MGPDEESDDHKPEYGCHLGPLVGYILVVALGGALTVAAYSMLQSGKIVVGVVLVALAYLVFYMSLGCLAFAFMGFDKGWDPGEDKALMEALDKHPKHLLGHVRIREDGGVLDAYEQLKPGRMEWGLYFYTIARAILNVGCIGMNVTRLPSKSHLTLFYKIMCRTELAFVTLLVLMLTILLLRVTCRRRRLQRLDDADPVIRRITGDNCWRAASYIRTIAGFTSLQFAVVFNLPEYMRIMQDVRSHCTSYLGSDKPATVLTLFVALIGLSVYGMIAGSAVMVRLSQMEFAIMTPWEEWTFWETMAFLGFVNSLASIVDLGGRRTMTMMEFSFSGKDAQMQPWERARRSFFQSKLGQTVSENCSLMQTLCILVTFSSDQLQKLLIEEYRDARQVMKDFVEFPARIKIKGVEGKCAHINGVYEIEEKLVYRRPAYRKMQDINSVQGQAGEPFFVSNPRLAFRDWSWMVHEACDEETFRSFRCHSYMTNNNCNKIPTDLATTWRLRSSRFLKQDPNVSVIPFED